MWRPLRTLSRVPLTQSSRSWRPASKLLFQRRYASDDIQKIDKMAGESVDAEETGVIEKTSQETVMYFDHILPFRTSNWDVRQWLTYLLVTDKRPEAIKEHVLKLANPVDENTQTPSIPGLEVTEVVPIRRDGGAFVKFKVPPQYNIPELNQKIQKNTIKESSNGLINWLTQSTAFSVKGTPWIEDLKRYPNKTIKVKFEGPALTEEELYSLFRRYGTIIDITPDPAVATVIFRSIRGAICSKNCITGMKINDTTLHISYDRYKTKNAIQEMIVNHTRIAIPIIIALIATLAVIIFDPIREFFIQNKITNKFTLSNNYFFKRIMAISNQTLSQIHHLLGQDEVRPSSSGGLWSERRDIVRELKLWIDENVNTFIVIRGPRGSGKHDLVMTHALNGRKDVLYLDCDKLVKSRNDTVFVRNAAASIGYYPVFPWLNSISTIVDLALTSLTGQKSGLSESKETQYRNMLSTALVAIREISLRGYKPVVQDGTTEVQVKEEDYLQQHPEKKPVIVIDRFTTINKSESNGFVYKELADWAAMLVSMNLAHVVFLTEDVGTTQLLSEALPDQVFKYVLLQDASKEAAKSYVLHSLHESFQLDENDDGEISSAELEKLKAESASSFAQLESQLDSCLDPIGGRMLDLQAFVRRVRSGEGPKEALERMVEQTAEQITQIFLNKDQGVKNAQAWELIKMLAEKGTVHYTEFINHPLFKSAPEASLVDLEQHGLISMTRDRGVLSDIRPAKPIFRAAFKNLLETGTPLCNVLETAYLYRVISFETGRIQKLEKELEALSWYTSKKEFNGRIQYLAGKIEASNQAIIKAEEEIKKLKAQAK